MGYFEYAIEEIKAEAVKNAEGGELFDVGVASGQLMVIYAFKELGKNPSREAIEDMVKKQCIQVLDKSFGYMNGISL